MLSKMLRVFMDGCNVNWKFLNILHTELDGKYETSLLEAAPVVYTFIGTPKLTWGSRMECECCA